MSFTKETDSFKLYVLAMLGTCVILLFLILVRDLIVPFRVNAYVAGSVYEGLEPDEPGSRSINVTISR